MAVKRILLGQVWKTDQTGEPFRLRSSTPKCFPLSPCSEDVTRVKVAKTGDQQDLPGFTYTQGERGFLSLTKSLWQAVRRLLPTRNKPGAFGLYVQPGLIEQMLKDPGLLKLGGEEAELTVMFSDVEGFTTVSEKLPPTQLVNLLNEYLSAMSDAIMESWGTVDKYVGDGIMAFWGRPYARADHAVRACTACLNMLDQLRILNAKWKSEGRLELNIQVALNTGPMVVGNIGSLMRFNSTVISHGG